MATVVFFHAHPDDEAISTGGTMASLAEAGHRIVLVTATRGELGEVPPGMLREGESLAQRRSEELRHACATLGVSTNFFLGFRDSGMAGEPSNDDPDSFCRADLQEAAGRLAEILRSEEADVLTVYDEKGGYGHPDHIQVHKVGIRAAELAGTQRVYMATINRTYLLELVQFADTFRIDFDDEQRQMLETLGVEAHRVTTAVDVSAQLERKRRAMECHATQITDTSFFLTMPPGVFAAVWGTEWYIRVGAEAGAALETSLIPPAPTPA